jgi:putative MFS transporter
MPGFLASSGTGQRPLHQENLISARAGLLLLGIFPSAAAWIILLLFAVYAILIGGTQILQWIYCPK